MPPLAALSTCSADLRGQTIGADEISGLVEPTNPICRPTQRADRREAQLRGSIDGVIVGNFDYAVMQINRCEPGFIVVGA